MKRTIIKHLLPLFFICFVSASYADNYDDRCFIAQIEAGTTQAEMDALFNQFNLYIADGPTTAFINQFVLVCVDPELGFPDNIPLDANGNVDINGVILNATAIDAENDDILDATGLNYDLSQLPSPTGPSSPTYRHPLSECGPFAFSINTTNGTHQREVGILDTGIKTYSETGMDAFFDPYDLGWNIIEDNFDPADDNGHGTHMASCIVSDASSNLPSVLTLKAYKTNDITGTAGIWELIVGINHALLDGVEIVNVSTSYASSHNHRLSDAPLKIAIEEAKEIGGILFVCAAGNKGYDNDDPNTLANYPASFPNDNILAVAALDCNYMIPSWANKGAISVDIAAPGVNIWGSNHLGEYVKITGSSPATALTTGLAAKLATQQPEFDYREIKCAIINGANKSIEPPLETFSLGYLDGNLAQEIFDTGHACNAGSIPGSGSNIDINEDIALDASIQDGTTLSLDAPQEQVVTIDIYNLLGQRLSNTEVQVYTGQNIIDLTLPDYPFTATYICHLQYGKQSKTLKFVK